MGFVGITPGVDLFVPTFEFPIGITFVLVGGMSTGNNSASFKVTDEKTKRIIFETPPMPTKVDESKARSVFAIQTAAKYPQPGKYRLEVIVNRDPVFSTTFDLTLKP